MENYLKNYDHRDVVLHYVIIAPICIKLCVRYVTSMIRKKLASLCNKLANYVIKLGQFFFL